MNGVHSAHLVPHVPGARALNSRTYRRRSAVWVWCTAALLGVAPALHAQQMPQYGSGSYPPGYPQAGNTPYPYYAPTQPVQPAQNIYYGNYQSNTVPGYMYPRNYPPQNYINANGNGVTYYYVQNPNGPTSYPMTSPYGTPRSYQAQGRTPTWPAPVPGPVMVTPPMTVDEELGDGRKPTASFHRATNENAWVKANYLATFISPMRLATPLVTSGSPLVAAPGSLGQPTTGILFGDRPVDFGLFSGIRLEAGVFLDRDNRFSLDIAGFYTFPNTQTFNTASDAAGNPLIARPIFNVATNLDGAFLNSKPGDLSGNVSIESKSEMVGLELNARYHSYLRERFHLESLVGFRYVRLAERLRIAEQINPISNNFLVFQGNPVNPPNSLADEDNFRTTNQFFGPQIGSQLSWEYGWFTVEGFLKFALGATRQETTINGATTFITPAGNQTANGGILALPSNSGTHSRTVVGIIPELGVNLGVDVCQHVRLNLGYSLLLWNAVVRPGNQIDRNVNPNQVPGSPTFGAAPGAFAPSYRFNNDFLWTQTFNMGVEFRY